MKLAYHLVLSLGFTFGLAFAEVANEPDYSNVQWAHGVSVNGETGKVEGWYDAEKNKAEVIDDMMCYAASASNLLAWWQNTYAVASDAPTELEDIWGAFKENNQYAGVGGSALGAINWWLSGVYSPAREVENPEGDSSAWVWDSDSPLWDRYYAKQSELEAMFGQDAVNPVTLPNLSKKGEGDFRGYYYDQYGLTQEKLSDFLVIAWIYGGPITPDEPEVDDKTSGAIHHTMTLGDIVTQEDEGSESIYDIEFATILKDSAISLNIYSDGPVDKEGNSLAHSITLWGVEYENGALSKLWLTDSDDYTEQLFSVSVTLDEKENKIYLGTLITEKEGETLTEPYYYVEEYGKNVFIGIVYALDTSEIANWQLVPEPATATLSLLALAALAARRRRTCNADCRIQNAE